MSTDEDHIRGYRTGMSDIRLQTYIGDMGNTYEDTELEYSISECDSI